MAIIFYGGASAKWKVQCAKLFESGIFPKNVRSVNRVLTGIGPGLRSMLKPTPWPICGEQNTDLGL